LLQKTVNLLKEEIVATVFSLVTIDFPSFYNQFLPYLLEQATFDIPQKESLQKNFLVAKDLPTFGIKMDQFLNDWRVLSFCVT